MDKTKNLVELITKGIQDKKGHGIVIADLSEIDGTICRYFVICQGNSTQQVEAIAGSVSDYVRETIGEKPINCVGLGVLPKVFYVIEFTCLWEDAKLTTLPDLD